MTTKKQTKKENGKQATVKHPDHREEKFLKEAYEKAGLSAGMIARECGVSRAGTESKLYWQVGERAENGDDFARRGKSSA
jgi:hypothetical protein